MIFKNPYGYLIKHFKLIHLFLTGLYIYLAIKVNSILSFYNRFISGSASKLDAISYINRYYFVIILISILICATVYALMRYKKKPRFLYLILIAFYIVVAVMINVSFSGLQVISFSILETKTLRLYRDLLSIMIFLQYVSIAIVLVRGLGFDIKKFNFVADLAELSLDEKDEEEIELALGGNQSIQRKVHRSFRELRYYYIENKIFIIIVGIIILVIAVGSFYTDKEIVNKVYGENEIFSTDEYRFQVLNTYVTNRDINNSVISSTDTSFVIVRMMMGTLHEKKKFNTSNLVLEINHHSYSSNSRYGARFLDLGNAYKNAMIGNQSTYLFIFSVDNNDLGNKMMLDYANSKKVQLNPISLDEIVDDITYHVGDSIDLASSPFGLGQFYIKSYELGKQFAYNYQYEIMGKENTARYTISSDNNIVMHLVLDSSLPANMTSYSFLSDLGKLKYKVGDDEYVSTTFNDKTPNSYKDGLYLAVDQNIENASNIWFEISVRNQKYIYILK